MKGGPVFFLTGVDHHGQKVQQSAEKEGVAPHDFVQRDHGEIPALWEKLGIIYDRWAATTDPLHRLACKESCTADDEAGQLYKAGYSGDYSVRQEQFLTDKERGQDGNLGPEWGEVDYLEEEN